MPTASTTNTKVKPSAEELNRPQMLLRRQKDKCQKIALSVLFQLGDLVAIRRLDNLPDRTNLVRGELFLELLRNRR